MFIQIIQGRCSRPEDLRRLGDRWTEELAPGAPGWLGGTYGFTDDGMFVGVVRFDSRENAMANAERARAGRVVGRGREVLRRPAGVPRLRRRDADARRRLGRGRLRPGHPRQGRRPGASQGDAGPTPTCSTRRGRRSSARRWRSRTDGTFTETVAFTDEESAARRVDGDARGDAPGDGVGDARRAVHGPAPPLVQPAHAEAGRRRQGPGSPSGGSWGARARSPRVGVRSPRGTAPTPRPKDTLTSSATDEPDLRPRPPRPHRGADGCPARAGILVLDGAMGTAIQRDRPDEADYRGERFADWPSDVQGNNDLLTLTQPEIIAAIHREYLEAGADIIETNTFNANAISLADYGMQELAYELNFEAARLARREADAMTGADPRPAPLRRRRARPHHPHRLDLARTSTTRACATSASPSWSTPTSSRPAAWSTAAPTCCSSRRSSTPSTPRPPSSRSRPSSRSAAAAGRSIISGTITDASGRTLSGQVTEAFWNSVRHARPLAVGLNCALGAAGDAALPRRARAGRRLLRLLLPQRRAAQRLRRVRRGARPDRGDRRRVRRPSGLVNLVGGCCGTTPDHIAAIAKAVAEHAPRTPAEREPALRLSGLEPLDHHRGLAVRQRRRAHQHHRLRPVPQPDQGRRLRHRALGRPPAGRGRRAGHRHQHGRGDDRRRRGDGPLHQADRLASPTSPGCR